MATTKFGGKTVAENRRLFAQEQEKADIQAAGMFGNPFAAAAYMAGSQLGRGVGGLFGGVSDDERLINEQMAYEGKLAAIVDSLDKDGIDSNTPEGLVIAGDRLKGAGLRDEAEAMYGKARDLTKALWEQKDLESKITDRELPKGAPTPLWDVNAKPGDKPLITLPQDHPAMSRYLEQGLMTTLDPQEKAFKEAEERRKAAEEGRKAKESKEAKPTITPTNIESSDIDMADKALLGTPQYKSVDKKSQRLAIAAKTAATAKAWEARAKDMGVRLSYDSAMRSLKTIVANSITDGTFDEARYNQKTDELFKQAISKAGAKTQSISVSAPAGGKRTVDLLGK